MQSSFVKHELLLSSGTPHVQMPVSAWHAKSRTFGFACAGQAPHTRRPASVASGASLHVSAFEHESCWLSPKNVRYYAQQRVGMGSVPKSVYSSPKTCSPGGPVARSSPM